MSKYERPTVVSDGEQSATPVTAASAHAPAAGPAEEPPGPLAEVGLRAEGAHVATDPIAGSDSGSAATAAFLRPRNVALISVAVVALVLAVIFGLIAREMWQDRDVRITTPPRVAGLVLDDSQGAHDTIDYLRTAVQTAVSLEKSTGAVYADEAGQSRSVLFVGGTGPVTSPDDALIKTFRLINDDTGGVENIHSVPTGPLGGVMKCGSTKTDGGSMAVCGWADRRSLGIAMFPNRPPDQSAELLRTMRTAMQNRG